jgi:hypothetical protein
VYNINCSSWVKEKGSNCTCMWISLFISEGDIVLVKYGTIWWPTYVKESTKKKGRRYQPSVDFGMSLSEYFFEKDPDFLNKVESYRKVARTRQITLSPRLFYNRSYRQRN